MDRYWHAIVGNGGAENACCWCRDRWGFFWQITPRLLMQSTIGSGRAKARRAMDAIVTMKKVDIATLETAAEG